MSSLISVVIPLYNREDYIGECIESVLNQTHSNFQLIVVNNGCTDGSREVAAQFTDSRVEILDIEVNEGWPPAFNLGFTKAKGEWVHLLPSDDKLQPETLERLVAEGEKTGCDGVYCWLRGIDQDSNPSEQADREHSDKYAYKDTSPFDYRSSRWNIVGCFNGILWRRTALDKCLPVPNMIVADWAIMLRAFRARISWTVIPERLVDYRRHDDNLSETTDSTQYYIEYYYAHFSEYRPTMREQDEDPKSAIRECQKELIERIFSHFPDHPQFAIKIALASERGFDAANQWPDPAAFTKWVRAPFESSPPEEQTSLALISGILQASSSIVREKEESIAEMTTKLQKAKDRANRLREELDRGKLRIEKLRAKMKG